MTVKFKNKKAFDDWFTEMRYPESKRARMFEVAKENGQVGSAGGSNIEMSAKTKDKRQVKSNLDKTEFYKTIYLERLFDANTMLIENPKLSFATLPQVVACLGVCEDKLGATFFETDEIGVYKLSKDCWIPKSLDSDITIYPLSGRRKATSIVKNLFCDYLLDVPGRGTRGMKAIHLCGNHQCCNPSHIWWIPSAVRTDLECNNRDVRVAFISELTTGKWWGTPNLNVSLLAKVEQDLTAEGLIQAINIPNRIDRTLQSLDLGPKAKGLLEAFLRCIRATNTEDTQLLRLGYLAAIEGFHQQTSDYQFELIENYRRNPMYIRDLLGNWTTEEIPVAVKHVPRLQQALDDEVGEIEEIEQTKQLEEVEEIREILRSAELEGLSQDEEYSMKHEDLVEEIVRQYKNGMIDYMLVPLEIQKQVQNGVTSFLRTDGTMLIPDMDRYLAIHTDEDESEELDEFEDSEELEE